MMAGQRDDFSDGGGNPRTGTCDRCGAGAVLGAHFGDGRREHLCEEHGYAGTWVTSEDRQSRLTQYRVRGMPGDALIAGAMFMMKRTRNWSTTAADPSLGSG